MTLTVPRAGTSGGAAARVRVETPQVGAAVAEFGQVMKQIGDRTLADTLQREALRFQTDLTADMNTLRLEVSQIADPDQAETTWMERSQELRKTYLEGQREDGRPHVSPANVERFGLVFDELNNRNAFSVGKQVLGQRHAEREATYIRHVQVAGQAAAIGDADARQIQMDLLIDHVDQLEAAGVIDAAEAERRRIGAVSEIDNVRAMRLMSDDPQGLISEMDAGTLNGLDAETQQSYRSRANTRIAQMQAENQRLADAAQKSRSKEIGDALAQMRGVFEGGKTPANLALLNSEDVKKHPDYAQTKATEVLTSEKPELQRMTPDQIDALIAGEKAAPATKKWQTERLAVLQDLRTKAAKGWSGDQVAYAREIGLVVPDLPDDLNAQTAAQFASVVSDRADMAADHVAKGYVREGRLFDDSEADQIKQALSVQNDPADRLSLATHLLAKLPKDSPQKFEDILGDRVLSHAAGLMAAGGTEAVAMTILRGQQAIEEKTAIAPSTGKHLLAAQSVLGRMFDGVPNGDAIMSTVLDAADAHYAATHRGVTDGTDFNSDAYRQSLHQIMGGTGEYDSREARGGVQEVRDIPTALPGNTRARDVEDALRALKRDLAGVKSAVDPRAVSEAVDIAAQTGQVFRPITRLTADQARQRGAGRLRAASRFGNLPGYAGQPLTADDLDDLAIRAIHPGVYVLIDDRGQAVPDIETGSAWEFRLDKLMEAYR